MTLIEKESLISARHLVNLNQAKKRTQFLINHFKEQMIYHSDKVCDLIVLKDKDLIRETFYQVEIRRHAKCHLFYKRMILKLTNYYNTLEYVEIKTN